MLYRVTITYDPEANLWVAASRDVPGLVLEDASPEGLNVRLRALVPTLLERAHLEPCDELIIRYEGPNCR